MDLVVNKDQFRSKRERLLQEKSWELELCVK
jgi:hypothetical protein